MADFLENELYHHGIKGQRWGVRRYQHEDGSLTPAGRRHWGVGPPEKGSAETTRSGRSSNSEAEKTESRRANSGKKNSEVSGTQKSSSMDSEKKSTTTDKSEKASSVTNDAKKALDKDTLKKALMIGGGVAIAGLAAYGAYKYIGNKECSKILDQSKFSEVGISVVSDALNASKGFDFDISGYQNTVASASAERQRSWNESDMVSDYLASWASIPVYSGGKNSIDTIYPEIGEMQTEIRRIITETSSDPAYAEPVDEIIIDNRLYSSMYRRDLDPIQRRAKRAAIGGKNIINNFVKDPKRFLNPYDPSQGVTNFAGPSQRSLKKVEREQAKLRRQGKFR